MKNFRDILSLKGNFTSIMGKKLVYAPFLDLLTKVRIAVRLKASLHIIEIILESVLSTL
jgi:hypothetical protein